MGRIAELFEKKALKTITDEEQKELNLALAEAKDVEPDTKPNEDEEADVEKMAQAFADTVGASMDSKLEKLVESLKEKDAKVVEEQGKNYIVDKNLGKKTVEELSEMKVQLTDRKSKGKKVTEVSMKTVHFVNALLTKNVEKLQLLSEGTASAGGYLVPEEFANMITEDIRDIAVMRTVAAPAMTISGDTLHSPSLVDRPKAQWRAEKAVKATSTATFSETVLTPYSLAVIVGLSQELADDASLGVNGSVVNYIAGLMAQSLSEREEQAFWVGDGSGKPTGIDNYTLRLVNAGAGATDAQKADAIISAFQRTPQGYRNRGVWVGNSSTWEEVGRLKDSQGNYLLTRLADSPTQSLRGRPVYEQNDIGGGKLFFGDYSYYQIVDREGISIKISDEATVGGSSAFEKNLVYVRVEKRTDGELLLNAAITEVQGLGTI
jgi:HK97 family phage major capsid protein